MQSPRSSGVQKFTWSFKASDPKLHEVEGVERISNVPRFRSCSFFCVLANFSTLHSITSARAGSTGRWRSVTGTSNQRMVLMLERHQAFHARGVMMPIPCIKDGRRAVFLPCAPGVLSPPAFLQFLSLFSIMTNSCESPTSAQYCTLNSPRSPNSLGRSES